MQLVQIVTVFSCIVIQLQSVAGLKYRAEPNVVPIVPASAFGNELETARSAPKSPLLEIVLRILDSIQIVPKKRYQLRQLTSSRRFYDMVLGVLGVMETEARHQVQRARDRKQEIVRSANGGDDRPTSEEQPA
uniref:Corticotropin-releasing factor domain-containing protein n=1 Tax=Anopheles coluzzii TaxID=1518534 RepID=A0A8W7PPL8_ANOCL